MQIPAPAIESACTVAEGRIFISYSRKDGEAFAQNLHARLIDEFSEDNLWQDRAEMESGVGWWNQIVEALENCDFMMLVATPGAMASDIVRKEWRTARQMGVCVAVEKLALQKTSIE